ncbi:arylsulfatase b-like [Plakobranchus ocellatus]|uniref:Arylsulfatase b-like n=1 Tax=Plakobranchus ocellatus TaxID=259542 RepID=A0AAV3ZKI7_9GAST|nr:arylsulfatase b-like [Plakobranchus ocellatus]
MGNYFLPQVLLLVLGLVAQSHVSADKADSEASSANYRTQRKPNIVFILADDLGFHDVGYHGSRIRTPTLDKLSENGVRLENYYVQPICSPTRSQLMTGRYQIHNGIQHSLFWDDQPTGLPTDSPTLADKLREAGYSTHLVGKWHLGFYKQEYMPNNRGFDTSYGFLGGHESHYNHTRAYKSKGSFLDLRCDGEPVLDQNGRHSTYMYTQRAVDVISAHDKSKPLFLYMAYQAPHNPLEVPEAYEAQYQDIKDKNRRKYAGLVTMLDEGVANLTRALKTMNLWNDTILIFSTDNGGQVRYGGNNYPLRGWKFSLWEGGVRGVGFVTGGDNIRLGRGTVNKQLMHVSDWFPTLVGVAGGSLNGTKPLDGYDQWRTLSVAAPTPRKWLLHNIDPLFKKKGKEKQKYAGIFDTRVRAAIRVGEYKLLTGNPGNGTWIPPPESNTLQTEQKTENSKKNTWLFNIKNDPEERNDLSEKKPEVVKSILRILAKINATAVPPFFPKSDPLANPELHGGIWGPWE